MMRKLLLIGLALLTLAAQQATTEPTVTTISVWWADSLYPLDDENVADLLQDQFDDFNRNSSQIQVEVRIKRAEGAGSIYTTLFAGESIAPNAMPDLVLLRRADLERAAASGLIMTVDTWLPDTMRQDLLPNVLPLGEIDGILYGLPYAVTLQHSVYNPTFFETPPQNFENLLTAEQRFLLPGLPRSDQQVSDIVLAQYLQAGGRLVNSDGTPTLDPEPLLAVLTFYEAGLQAGIFSAEIAGYDVSSDYWGRYAVDDIPLMVVNSTLFLQQGDALAAARVAALPSFNGEPLILLDGWVWALVTVEPEQQNGALAFLEWIMRPDQQAAYSEAFGVLPSQRPALRIWSNESYARQVTDWMPTSLMLPLERRNNAATQLQTAFIAVLNGTSADDAASAAFNALSQ